MRAWDVTFTHSVRVTEDDVCCSIEIEDNQEITATEAERVAVLWMDEPEHCNESHTVVEVPGGAPAQGDEYLIGADPAFKPRDKRPLTALVAMFVVAVGIVAAVVFFVVVMRGGPNG